MAGTITGTDQDRSTAFVKWHTISNLEQSLVEDVARIRSHPLVPKSIPIHFYIYDVRTGRLIKVPAATTAGQAG